MQIKIKFIYTLSALAILAAMAPSARAANVSTPQWSAWGAVLGGGGKTDGNPDEGTSDVKSYGYGIATGWEKFISPTQTMGFSIIGGGLGWKVADDLGDGSGVFLQAGIDSTKILSTGYVSASANYGWHGMKSSRAAEDETITSEFMMHSVTTRLEAGHALSANITPYAALQVGLSHTPAYAEDTAGDVEDLALAYGDATQATARTELGLKWKAQPKGTATSFSGSLAWAHNMASDETVEAHSVAVIGDSFALKGSKPASDSALASLGATISPSPGMTISLNLNGEASQESLSYGGNMTVAWIW